jgi:hypothetical protein
MTETSPLGTAQDYNQSKPIYQKTKIRHSCKQGIASGGNKNNDRSRNFSTHRWKKHGLQIRSMGYQFLL